MLGESPAQILGMLSYSWWPCNLLHTAQCTGKGETTTQLVLATTIAIHSVLFAYSDKQYIEMSGGHMVDSESR